MKRNLIIFLVFLFNTGVYAQYCTSGGPTSTSDSNVESVAVSGDGGTAINYTGCPGVIGLEDSTTTHTVTVSASGSYTANIQFGTCSNGNYAGAGEAWIDWNQNDVFDAAESIGTWVGTPPATLSAFAFTVPPTAFNGTTRMRVMQQEGGGSPLNPCATYDWGSMTDFSVVVTGGVTNTCPSPSALTSANATVTDVDLGWTDNAGAANWVIEYGPIGFTLGTGNIVTASTNPFSLTGLNSSTTYDFYVRAVCAPGDSSAWVGPSSFSTACGVITAPWTETFVGTSTPNCWTEAGEAYRYNTGAGYAAATAGDYTAGGGTNYAWIDGSTPNSPLGTGDTLTSPQVDVSSLTTPHLCFALFSNNISDAGNNTINVEFWDGAAWNLVSSNQQNFGQAWAPFSIDLSTYTITGPVQARFITFTNSTGSAFFNDILIDDVSFNNGGCPQFCPSPSLLAANNITQSGADISWTSNAGNWIVEYGPTGFTPGSGTSVTTTNNPLALTGLTDNTSFDVYILAVCAPGDTSLISSVLNFTTLANCPFPTALNATNATPTTADLNWTENGSATTWFVEYGPAGFTLGSGTGVTTTTNPHALTGLSDNTNYNFYVRAICAPGDTSAWAGPFAFNTPCLPVTGDSIADPIIIGAFPYADSSSTASCYSDTRGNLSADVFYQLIVPACTDTLVASLCGSAFDTYIRILDAAGTEIALNDDFCAAQSEVTLTGLTAGDTLFVIVEGFGSNNGTYSLNINTVINCPPPADLRITEIMYNPPESGNDSLEFLELYNNGNTTVDLTGYTFSDGVTLAFTGGSIPAGGYFTIAGNAAAFQSVYGVAADAQWTSGALGNGGELVKLVDNIGQTVDSVDFADNTPWPSGSASGQADGGGASIVLCDLTADQNDGANWSASTQQTGVTVNGEMVMASPGARDSICNVTTPVSTDVAVSAHIVDALICNTTSLSGIAVITNNSADDADSVSYTILVNGTPAINGVVNLGPNQSDSITVGPLAVTTGSYTLTTIISYANDTVPSNDTLSTVTVISNTTSTITLDSALVCNGDSNAVLSGAASNGIAPYNYFWSTSATTTSVSGLAANTYSLVVTDSFGCFDIDSFTITEPAALVATAVDNGNGTATAAATGGTPNYNFVWSNGQTDSTATNLTNGNYTVTVTDDNGCTDTVSVNVTVVNVSNIANVSNLSMFPNPTNGKTFIQMDLVETAEVSIQIFNVTGQVINTQLLGEVKSESIELPTQDLPAGVYFVRMNIGTEQITQRLIVKKY